ncbi:MAG: glutamate synthase subunit alpha, partial [Halobacteriales archaeon]|nr:glutamate synthase subunit alpha [Halobacteriales archaeon]
FASGAPRQLADPTDARSNCGVGVVMDLSAGRSHDVVADGLELLCNLEHRGTTGAEENTGDGAGIMLQRPDAFFDHVFESDLSDPYAVGSIFFPQDDAQRLSLIDTFESVLTEHDLVVREWRTVPTDNSDLGATALESEPATLQPLVEPATDMDTEAFDRALYVARRAAENAIEEDHPDIAEQFYVCSLDRKLVVYKGLLKSPQLPQYYPDLTDQAVASTFVLVHARFSTNTLGAWHLAHPYRHMIHNGEFNTIQGNINWMRARETDLETPAFESDIDQLKPIINDPEQSDTASVDNALELLIKTGRDLPHALRMLIPEAWRADDHMPEDRKAFYDYHASLVEPWDGPALVVGTDGDRIGAVLDRNGLRPCRYELTDDDRLIMASEAGALPTPADHVVERGRLKPGQLFLADPEEGRVVPDDEVFDRLTDDRYEEWVVDEQVPLSDVIDETE